MKTLEEYTLITGFYGGATAKRSGVRLINHINEGLALLDAFSDMNDRTRGAWCLHPVVQNVHNGTIPSNEPYYNWAVKLPSFPLAVEYSEFANHYLCHKDTDHIRTKEMLDQHLSILGPMSKACAQMLWADKIQNRKDFRWYHQGTHERSDELTHYFDLWIEYLNWYLKIVKL